MADKDSMRRRILRLRKALAFYADERTWRTLTDRRPFPTVADVDRGRRAREALGLAKTFTDELPEDATVQGQPIDEVFGG